MTILRDGVFIPRCSRISGAEIGARHGGIRPRSQILLIGLDSAVDVPGLMPADGLFEDPFGRVGLSIRTDWDQQRYGEKEQIGVALMHSSLSQSHVGPA